MSKYYVVVNGRIPGIYTSWEETKRQVIGYPKAVHKSFKNKQDAYEYYTSMNKLTALHEVSSQVLPQGEIALYTDGSTIDRYGGCGVLYMVNREVKFKEKYMVVEYPTTNNRAELWAIYYGLLIIKDHFKDKIPNIHLYTDSLISIQSLSSSYGNWKKNLEITLANKDIMLLIYPILNSVIFHHVNGHSGDIYNEEVDILAKAGTYLSKIYLSSLSS